MIDTPVAKKPKYIRNFLTKVILRLDFSSNIELNFLQNFSNEIKEFFPIQENKENVVKVLVFDGKTNEFRQETSKAIFWNYFNGTKTKKLEIASDHVFIEYEKYSDSMELLQDVENVICRFIDSSKVETINRLGLRYVNDLDYKEMSDLGLESLFSGHLLGAKKFVDETEKKYARAMGQIVFKKDDGDLTFNFGVWNRDFPNEATRPNFVLDIDSYSRLPFEASSREVLKMVKAYNAHIERVFEASILPGYRDLMNKS